MFRWRDGWKHGWMCCPALDPESRIVTHSCYSCLIKQEQPKSDGDVNERRCNDPHVRPQLLSSQTHVSWEKDRHIRLTNGEHLLLIRDADVLKQSTLCDSDKFTFLSLWVMRAGTLLKAINHNTKNKFLRAAISTDSHKPFLLWHQQRSQVGWDGAFFERKHTFRDPAGWNFGSEGHFPQS